MSRYTELMDLDQKQSFARAERPGRLKKAADSIVAELEKYLGFSAGDAVDGIRYVEGGSLRDKQFLEEGDEEFVGGTSHLVVFPGEELLFCLKLMRELRPGEPTGRRVLVPISVGTERGLAGRLRVSLHPDTERQKDILVEDSDLREVAEAIYSVIEAEFMEGM